MSSPADLIDDRFERAPKGVGRLSILESFNFFEHVSAIRAFVKVATNISRSDYAC